MCIQNVHEVVQDLKNTSENFTYQLELVPKCLNCHDDVEALKPQWENNSGRKLIIRTFRVHYSKAASDFFLYAMQHFIDEHLGNAKASFSSTAAKSCLHWNAYLNRQASRIKTPTMVIFGI